MSTVTVKYKKSTGLTAEVFPNVILKIGNGLLIMSKPNHEWGVNLSEVQAYELRD